MKQLKEFNKNIIEIRLCLSKKIKRLINKIRVYITHNPSTNEVYTYNIITITTKFTPVK